MDKVDKTAGEGHVVEFGSGKDSADCCPPFYEYRRLPAMIVGDSIPV